MTQLPDFATNHASTEAGLTVADKVNELFCLLRENKVTAPPIAIATAYVNPAGFALLADELELAPRVRLLLGAEPEEESVRAITSGDSDQDARRDAAIEHHQAWLEAERDTMGFARIPTAEAKRMVEWLKSMDVEQNPRVEVRRYSGGFLHGKTYLVEDNATQAAIAGSSNMTYAGLARNAELNLGTGGGTGAAGKVREWFEHYWSQSDSYDLAELYGRLWDPHTPWAIYLRMLWELYGEHLDSDENPEPHTRLELTRFQADGVVRMERLLDEHGGVLVADEVGLGKTYLAGEVIYRTANINRQRVLIVAPAALKSSMWEPFLESYDFSRWVKVYSYEEVRNRLDPDRGPVDAFLQEVADYSLVVIDEAHNLRNSGAQRSGAVDRVITAGGSKRVVLLTATPVNNSLTDLETLVKYFIRDDARFAALGIPSIREYIKQAQAMDPANLTPEHLFDLMDQVAVRRTRKFVKEHYANELIRGADGKLTTLKFPQPKVRRIDYDLNDDGLALIDAMVYALDDPTDPHASRAWEERSRDPQRLMLARYLSSMYTVDHDLQEYQITNAGLLRSGLLKRLESSPQALHASLENMIASHESFLEALGKGFVLKGEALSEWVSSDSDDLDAFVAEFDNDEQIESVDGYHLTELQGDVESDIALLCELRDLAHLVIEGVEPKVEQLVEELTTIAADAQRVDPRGLSHADRRKVIVFSAFTDTIIPIHDAVVEAIQSAPAGSPLADYRARIAPPIMGSYAKTHERGATGGVDQGGRASTIAGFAPATAGPRNAKGEPAAKDEFDILFTTDVLSEGVNLQQAGQMINYDLPWNPMRIVQRHGRVDRIGSKHDYVHLGLFFPAERLDALLDLEARLEAKLALADAAVGAGNVLPGRGPGHEVNLTDDQVTDEFEKLLDAGGSSASLSGEEYRRRLSSAFNMDPLLKADILGLPYGSGSGFVNPVVNGNGYVFCIKIGKSPKPWFRYVPVDDDWSLRHNEDGHPLISSDTLLSLRVADPQNASADRWLPDEVYDHAFDAWEVARDSVYNVWQELTDPNAFQPDLPLSFRDAYALVFKRGGYLGRDAQIALANRLRSVPSAKVSRQVRGAINQGRTDEERIKLITEVLDEAGISAPPPREPLPDVEKHEVRLVTWLAVKGTRALEETAQ
ncbi:helicase domain protein [Gordonia bronchialis DSM 43247]|uniref:Helicase domain protein n=1 Tax=Gordonia bronchialis (strain ATCC 25592 / DSM 43247 / BCRC 13721 / JCM 3198 / KCTC 3076 / NBRC 16047 / NCTC 10667) TaxID=526226 RepID=D0LA64_GORB4|nr:SNF2-related protein [Gordonia bronchialis]ACY19393.1 helicase domain protein [Gordonia bronchialis DSM 43247]MCC3322174.1 phospholipase D-like domain-containing protein [Gordonia bronchialis]QGS26658.1 helicase [Gordonia bronchialis]STQ62139.1 RNA polymerase-associated protein rapA [Gordonia bronchialis]